MPDPFLSPEEANKPPIYRIMVKGELTSRWSDWFEGMSISSIGNDYTLISGQIVDQAALYGLLKKVRDLGLALVAVDSSKTDRTNNTLEEIIPKE